MKKICFFAVLLSVLAVSASKWQGLTDENWYSGPKLTEESLVGKVVLVDKWGVNCPPCRALLPAMQKDWNTFKNKNFVLLASHCQGRMAAEVEALVKEHKLSFSIYDNAGINREPPCNGIPFLYVVNHRGKVVYSGHNHDDAINAVQIAIKEANLPPTLMADVEIGENSPYRALCKQLILGKNISPVIRKLEADIRNSEKRAATDVQKINASVAKQILASIEEARTSMPKEIEALRKPIRSPRLLHLKITLKRSRRTVPNLNCLCLN